MKLIMKIKIFPLFNEEGVINNNLNTLFKSKKKSRFDFANNNKENDKNKKEKSNVPKIVQEIVDELSLRVSFFIPLNKYVQISKLNFVISYITKPRMKS